jgi:hypothetical protein
MQGVVGAVRFLPDGKGGGGVDLYVDRSCLRA